MNHERGPVRRLDWGSGLLLAAFVACSPADPQLKKSTEPVDIFSAIVAAGAKPISTDPLERDHSCARQTSVFVVAGDWVEFVTRIESELPSEFQRRDSGDGGVTIFSRSLPGDVESIELTPEVADQGHRSRVRYSICAG